MDKGWCDLQQVQPRYLRKQAINDFVEKLSDVMTAN